MLVLTLISILLLKLVTSVKSNKQDYLLISTSTRIYNLNLNNSSDIDIIYEYINSTNILITDLYFNSQSNIVYANVYDTITLTSDIISLHYDAKLNTWYKQDFALVRNQSNCLGKEQDFFKF